MIKKCDKNELITCTVDTLLGQAFFQNEHYEVPWFCIIWLWNSNLVILYWILYLLLWIISMQFFHWSAENEPEKWQKERQTWYPQEDKLGWC